MPGCVDARTGGRGGRTRFRQSSIVRLHLLMGFGGVAAPCSTVRNLPGGRGRSVSPGISACRKARVSGLTIVADRAPRLARTRHPGRDRGRAPACRCRLFAISSAAASSTFSGNSRREALVNAARRAPENPRLVSDAGVAAFAAIHLRHPSPMNRLGANRPPARARCSSLLYVAYIAIQFSPGLRGMIGLG